MICRSTMFAPVRHKTRWPNRTNLVGRLVCDASLTIFVMFGVQLHHVTGSARSHQTEATRSRPFTAGRCCCSSSTRRPSPGETHAGTSLPGCPERVQADGTHRRLGRPLLVRPLPPRAAPRTGSTEYGSATVANGTASAGGAVDVRSHGEPLLTAVSCPRVLPPVAGPRESARTARRPTER